MKKSKIIVPAAALLLFSTAASITGTVAWFTSTRVFNTSAGDFQVSKLDGDLSCVLAPGAGTKLSSGSDAIEAVTGAQFGDVSYDPAHTTFWKYTPAGATLFTAATTTPTTAATLETYSGSNLWYAASWTMTFSYTFVSDTTPVNVLLDLSASAFTKTDGGSADTVNGFRIAFVCGTRTVIWGDKRATTALKHIDNAAGAGDPATAGTAYASGVGLIGSDSKTSYTKAADKAASQSSRADYIGQITNSSGTGSITVQCYAWFEGTDADVVNGKAMNIAHADMSFYGRLNG